MSIRSHTHWIRRGAPRFTAPAVAVRQWLKVLRSYKGEVGSLATLLLFAALALTFGIVANEMTEGETKGFDTAIVLAMRSPHDHADPIGPRWFEEAVRDVTSLGSNTVLALVCLGAIGALVISGAQNAALLLVASVGGSAALMQLLKQVFGRVRPDLVSHSLDEVSRSFPSGHATLAAVTYLTLGVLVASGQTRAMLKIYVLGAAMVLTVLVGVSRVYLGMHWPTDVLAGWCLGSAWGIVCWLLAVQLPRHSRGHSAPR